MLQTLREWTERPSCKRAHEIAAKLMLPTVVMFLAMVVGWWLYPVIPLPWAEIKEAHVRWNETEQVFDIDLIFDKRAECLRPIVRKELSPIQDGLVLGTNPIPLKGNLDKKMADAPVGSTLLRDKARPIHELKHQEYLLTISASCNETDGSLLEPSRSTIPIELTIRLSQKSPPWTWLARARSVFS